ncbi:helix-turn-helix domain-containing protein [Pseudohoeflea suaedae]|nr:helix-turn-helix domain-containing protein [Pseudohoeflea suaedae]
MTVGGSVENELRLVPSLKFSTDTIRKEEQFDAWAAFNSMAELKPIGSRTDGFKASSSSHQLGRLQLTSFQLAPMHLDYTPAAQRRLGMDHWCMSVVTKGPVGYESNSSQVAVSPGRLLLHSYADPFSGVMDNTQYSSLFFARDDFWDVAEHLERGAHQLAQGPMAQILRDFMLSAISRADGLTQMDAAALNDAFGSLVRALVTNNPTEIEAAKAPIAAAQFDRARRFINANLKMPGLTPDAVCASIGVSRRQLFYLFERQGGVATYIRNRRLAACYSALVNAENGKQISTVAYEYGFTTISSFYRQFTARYGFGPGEARAAARSGEFPSHKRETTFVDWLNRLVEP